MALADYGVLVQESDYEGKTAQFELESNPEKIRFNYPALADLIETIKVVKPGESLNIWPVLSDLTEAPYGLGPYALSIFCACAFRNFGDELRLKVNPTGWGYSPTNDPEIIIDVATGKFPSATIERRSITPATAKLINEIYTLFSETPASAGQQQSLSEAWRALLAWWKIAPAWSVRSVFMLMIVPPSRWSTYFPSSAAIMLPARYSWKRLSGLWLQPGCGVGRNQRGGNR